MGNFTDAVYGNRMAQDVAAVAPLATTYHVAQPTPLAAPVQHFQPAPSNVAKAMTFFKDVGSSIGHIGETATKWLGTQTVHAIEAPVKFGMASGHLITDNSNMDSINKNSQLVTDRLNAATELYRSGRMSKADYQKSLNGFNQDFRNLDSQATTTNNQVKTDAGNFATTAIDTAADVVTIMTAGAGGVGLKSIEAQTAARFLASDATDATLLRGAGQLAHFAVNEAAFNALPDATQQVLQRAVAEVVANTGVRLSSGQIAKAAMVNLALKTPISFNYLSATGQDLYHQLDDAKYGEAVRNIAINSLLILGGGPVGEALHFLKGGTKIADTKIFGEGSFIDEIAKNTGDRNPEGIINYLNSLPADVKAEYVKNLSATATRNTNAAKGNPIQGAWRILHNMDAMYPGVDWRSLSHKEIVDDMMNEAKAARIASDAGRLKGIRNVVVGRFDRRERQTILATLTKDGGPLSKTGATDYVNPKHVSNYATKYNLSLEDAKAAILKQRDAAAPTATTTSAGQAGTTLAPASKAGEAAAYDAKYGATATTDLTQPEPVPLTTDLILQRWEALKKQFPNAAFANNLNLDRQIKGLAKTHEGNVAGFEKAFRGIQTQEIIDGVPTATKRELAKLGYIPIIPKNLENPFVEGTGKLVTKYGDDSLFTKAVAPMPVAAQLGSVLTHMGLSPQASTAKVYNMFQNNLVGGLRDRGILGVEGGSLSHQQQADSIFKQISSYAADPTRGGIKGVRPAITDMRQLTTKDIAAATGKSEGDARQIRQALRDAWLSVPLQTRGLGDRLQDVNFKLNPAAGWYSRVMGATRFSWNPFFQAKTLTKTESLVQLKTGGTAPTVLGLDKVLGTIFPDKYAEIEKTRQVLRENGIFVKGKGPIVAGEAVEITGTASAAGTRRLLSGQEKAISALVSVQADKVGMDTAEFVKQYPQAVKDTVQAIAGYDKSSGLLSSPLARTLNLAFFPYRFEAKVTQVMAKSLAHASPVTQMAVIRGLYQGSQFLKSPEGQVWYSQNSELIGLLKYFTPLTTIATIAEVFGQKPESVGAFGELGGLPFGFIPMLLDAEGITHGLTQSPYVNPKTGQTLPNYIPDTVKGHAIAGLQDFLGSLFTYPGTQAGLPSKTAFFHSGVNSLLAGSKSDFTKETPQLTNTQQKGFAATVQQLAGTAAPTPPGAPDISPSLDVPATTSPATILKAKAASASTKATKKKKSEYTPQLLPGQSVLGQL